MITRYAVEAHPEHLASRATNDFTAPTDRKQGNVTRVSKTVKSPKEREGNKNEHKECDPVLARQRPLRRIGRRRRQIVV